MEVFIGVIVAFAVAFGLGYWFAKRGAAGIEADYKDALAKVKELEAKAKGLA